MFTKIFSFEGRIRRLEYGISYLVYMFSMVSIQIFIEINEVFSLMGLLIIPIVYILFAQGAKRCHDIGKSGWYQIIPFYIFWMLFEDSQYGENKYGINPKGFGNTSPIDEIGLDLV